MRAMDAGAALGAAGFAISVASLLAQTAPDVPELVGSGPGTGTAVDLRAAEVTTGVVVVGAGAAASVLCRQWWPFLLTVATVGGAIGLYELLLRVRRPDAD